MPRLSAPTALDKYILNKNPIILVSTEKQVIIATALNKCFKVYLFNYQNKNSKHIYYYMFFSYVIHVKSHIIWY